MAKTDKELFREYLKTTVPGTSDTVADLYLKGFEFFGLEKAIAEMLHGIFNGDPEPIPEMKFFIQEVSGLASNFQHVVDGFDDYRAANA